MVVGSVLTTTTGVAGGVVKAAGTVGLSGTDFEVVVGGEVADNMLVGGGPAGCLVVVSGWPLAACSLVYQSEIC